MSGTKRTSEAGSSSSSGGNNAGSGGSSKRTKAVIQDLERLKCPVCLEYPKAEVYLCSNGHSVCSLCIEKLANCPSCRAPYVTGRGSNRGRQRNHLAEGILEAMLFGCRWREQGCKRKGLSRQQLSEHEGQCRHNPNRVNVCQMLLFGSGCSFKVAPAFFSHPMQEIPADFQEHLLNTHKKKVLVALSGVGSFVIHEAILVPGSASFYHGSLLQLKERPMSPDFLGYFMRFCYKDTSVADPKLSWFMVRITDKPQHFAVAVKFTLKGCSSSNNARDEEIPKNETCWNGRIMGLDEFHAFQAKAAGEREKFKFSLPLSHLREYYLNAEGGLRLRYEFTVTPINNDS